MSELALGQIKGLSVNSNKVTVPSGHTLYAPGHVVQVVQTSKKDPFTMSTALTWTDVTGFSATITPKFATSKILVIADFMANTGGAVLGQFRLMRDSTPVGGGDNSGSNRQSSMGSVLYGTIDTYYQYNAWQQGFNYLDSPGTTSAVTYKVQGYLGGSTTLYVGRSPNWGNAQDYGYWSSNITLMEIAA